MASRKSSSQPGDQMKRLTDDFAGLGHKDGKVKSEENRRIVFFSLDTTTSNHRASEICQIAAECGDNIFNVRMLPTVGIEPASTAMHGFRMVEGQQMWHYGQQVNDAVTQEEGLRRFLEFLSVQSGGTRSIVLAAHSIYRLHYPNIIRRLMCLYDDLMGTLRSIVLGFIDTYAVFKDVLEQLEQENVQANPSLSLNNIAEIMGIENYTEIISQQPHAVVNVQLLVALINDLFNTDPVAQLMNYFKCFDALYRLIDLRHNLQDVVSVYLLKKIANAGISVQDLIDHYHVFYDVTVLLAEHNGRPLLKPPAIQFINQRLANLISDNAN